MTREARSSAIAAAIFIAASLPWIGLILLWIPAI